MRTLTMKKLAFVILCFLVAMSKGCISFTKPEPPIKPLKKTFPGLGCNDFNPGYRKFIMTSKSQILCEAESKSLMAIEVGAKFGDNKVMKYIYYFLREFFGMGPYGMRDRHRNSILKKSK